MIGITRRFYASTQETYVYVLKVCHFTHSMISAKSKKVAFHLIHPLEKVPNLEKE
jgi:hypothetical protein